MKLLLDSSAVIWWFTSAPQLSTTARNMISTPEIVVYVSAASAWEICTKVRIGKLPGAHDLCDDFIGFVARHGFVQLPITVEHGRLAGKLPGAHKDPFDRMLAAQALVEDVPIITNDPAFAGFGARAIW